MARIRTIKPEFCQSESVGGLSRDARLLFIQLWTIADDAGRLRGASRMLASLLYPYDDDAPKLIGKWLSELNEKGCIRRYEVDGAQYIEIVNWLKHQKIDRPSESRIPPFDEASRVIASTPRASDADLGPRTGTKTKECSAANAAALSDFEDFWKAYPRTPVMSKQQAKAEWRKLNETERIAARKSVEPYKSWLAGKPDHPVVHACRFLSQKRFEGFDAVAVVTKPTVFVVADTPQFAAWEKFQGRKIPRNKDNGWHFESEWPPGHTEAA